MDIANQVIKLKMFPYFDIAHSLLCALSVKEDLGAGAHAFSRKHPLACWLSTMLVVFAGGMVAAGLLGEPILAPLKNTPQLLVATACWYIVSSFISEIFLYLLLLNQIPGILHSLRHWLQSLQVFARQVSCFCDERDLPGKESVRWSDSCR